MGGTIGHLVRLSTVFERFGDGTERAALVAMIARQEQDAQVQGVSTLEWIGILCKEAKVDVGGTQLSQQAGCALSACVHVLAHFYHVHVFA